MLAKYLSLQEFRIGLISNWIYSLGSNQWYASIDSDNETTHWQIWTKDGWIYFTDACVSVTFCLWSVRGRNPA